MAAMSPELAQAIIASARRLGVDPVDIGTAISYETGGKFDPNLWGGKNNGYLGLIQFGKEERAKYGVKPGQSATEQMAAVENFLRDRGVKPGMGMMDIYSTINAGSPGLYNRSDAANGGMPGTVADKVNGQMAEHRANVVGMLGGKQQDPVSPIDPTSTAAPPISLAAPVGALAAPPSTADILASAAGKMAPQQAAAPQQPEFLPLQQMQMPQANTGQSQQIAQALAKSYGWT